MDAWNQSSVRLFTASSLEVMLFLPVTPGEKLRRLYGHRYENDEEEPAGKG
jgi:hypothetical protein